MPNSGTPDAVRVNALRELLEGVPDALLLLDKGGTIAWANALAFRLLGYEGQELVGQSAHVLIPTLALDSSLSAGQGETSRPCLVESRTSVTARHRDGRDLSVDLFLSSPTIEHTPYTLCVIRSAARLRAHVRLQEPEQPAEYHALIEHAAEVFYRVAVGTDALRGRVLFLSPQVEVLTGHPPAAFMSDPDLWIRLVHHDDLAQFAVLTTDILLSHKPGTRMYRIRHEPDDVYRWIEDNVVPQCDDNGHVVGYLAVALDVTERRRQQQQQLALTSVTRALRVARTPRDVVQILLNEVMTQFDVNGVAFAAPISKQHDLYFELGRGELAAWTSLRLSGAESVGVRLAERGVSYVTNTAQLDPQLIQCILPAAVRAFASLPVQSSEELVGVLAVTKAEPFVESEIQSLTTIGEFAATAVQRLTAQEQLVLNTAALEEAYEATIEGWARALDMRDRITEGHTRRVTDMTLRLARRLGVNAEQLPHLRRGALLHDIGKMAVPDSILHKPGPLSSEELVIMRRHTEYAYDLLGPIDFLRPAIEIPYFHHERWDGTGYPRKLSGEAIPWAARVFAVADVYDAITSDRPYAAAETHQRAVDFIVSQSGKHFDPSVVDALLAVRSEPDV